MKASGNILFCGVGGQGILLASEITAFALLESGLDAKKSEVHGMAQRGGSVVAHLRYGEKVYSPLIDPGRADFAISFEIMEAARYLPFLHQGSKVIVNTQEIAPPAVALGKMSYPANLLDELRNKGITVFAIDAFELARGVGEIRTANIALVGALSSFLPVSEEVFIAVLKKRIPRKLEENLEAFKQGRKITADAA